ncbi:RDD family protein [Subtercola sp. RTI3]|uniref:RDD family protein n=1 Tax=Subtercola sp. RTI3 TaxID=3048639 RepID=UPI002B23C505|nr:RDD family protein [Subtercola sp. RTI3]MEA9986105.1 RDD family protein [Subtercola sp. RTI3]
MTNAQPPATPAAGPQPCVQCGSPVPANAQFCLACGTPVSSRTRVTALGTSPLAPADAVVAGGATGASWPTTDVAGEGSEPGVLAGNYGWRILAFALDGVFGGVITLLVIIIVAVGGGFRGGTSGGTAASGGVSGGVSITGLPFVLVILSAYLYPLASLFMQAFLGYSFGKLLTGLRVVSVDRPTTPGLLRMLLRDIIVFAASLVFGIGQLVVYLSPLWDPQRLNRGWHDRVAHTFVIDVRRGRNPLLAPPATDPSAFAPPAASPAPGLLPVPAPAPASTLPAEAEPAVSFSPPEVPSPAPLIASVPGFAPPPPAAAFAPAPRPDEIAPPPAPGAFASTPVPPETTGDARFGAVVDAFDDLDVDSTRLADLRRPAAVAAAPTAGLPAVPVTPATPRLAFRFDSGELFVVDRPGVLGRDPIAPAAPASAPSTPEATPRADPLSADPRSTDPRRADPLIVRVPGDAASVSKTHLTFGFSATAPTLWIVDRGSTNGTVLVQGGRNLPLVSGEPLTVRAGDTVRIGTRSFQVEEAS